MAEKIFCPTHGERTQRSSARIFLAKGWGLDSAGMRRLLKTLIPTHGATIAR